MQCGKHAFDAAGETFVPVFQHFAHHLPLQIGLRAAQVAGNDGELLDFGVFDQILFFHIGQRANHDVFAVVAHQLGRHGFELAAVEHV